MPDESDEHKRAREFKLRDCPDSGFARMTLKAVEMREAADVPVFGSITATKIITDGFRYETFKVLSPGEVFMLGAPTCWLRFKGAAKSLLPADESRGRSSLSDTRRFFQCGDPGKHAVPTLPPGFNGDPDDPASPTELKAICPPCVLRAGKIAIRN